MQGTKKQIQPRISQEIYDLLTKECQRHQCTAGDIIEAALRAYLLPATESDKLDRILEQDTNIMGILGPLAGEQGTAGQGVSEPKPRIVTYKEMYGPTPQTPLRPSPPPVPVKPQKSRFWRRWG